MEVKLLSFPMQVPGLFLSSSLSMSRTDTRLGYLGVSPRMVCTTRVLKERRDDTKRYLYAVSGRFYAKPRRVEGKMKRGS